MTESSRCESRKASGCSTLKVTCFLIVLLAYTILKHIKVGNWNVFNGCTVNMYLQNYVCDFDCKEEQREPKETQFDLFFYPVEMKMDQMN